MSDKYYPGKDCICHAHSEYECACSVDWTEPEVYELRARLEEAKEEITRLQNASYRLAVGLWLSKSCDNLTGKEFCEFLINCGFREDDLVLAREEKGGGE